MPVGRKARFIDLIISWAFGTIFKCISQVFCGKKHALILVG